MDSNTHIQINVCRHRNLYSYEVSLEGCSLKLFGDLISVNRNTLDRSYFRTNTLARSFSFHIIHIVQS